jgi:serine protease Do
LPGDVILTFDGTPVPRSSLLQWVASTAGVGKTVSLRLSRDGKPFDLKVILGQLADSPVPRQRLDTQPSPPGDPFDFGPRR